MSHRGARIGGKLEASRSKLEPMLIGTNLFDDCPAPITISNIPLFSLWRNSQGDLRLNFRIDSPPAIARIDIKDNKVKCGSVRMESSLKSGIELSLWTTDAGGMNVSIEDKDAHHLNSYANRKILGVFSAAPGTIALIELDLRPLGLPIYMDKVSLKIGGATLSFNTFKKLKTGLVIER